MGTDHRRMRRARSMIRDLTGQTFGRLIAIRLAGFTIRRSKDGKSMPGQAIWLCKCACGNEKEIVGSSLTAKRKATRSCDCIAREKAAARLKGIRGQDSIAFGHRVTVASKRFKREVCYAS